ncbi:MAG: DNA mismatch repair endonuclease MutL [Candidatus Dasytiphilus stammeri]
MQIKKLPRQITNQIAAGEVIERPASVVKELLENSLDAGANRINVEINKGGIQLIRIRDNGCGINKNEILLALDNHTTSKISTIDDLTSITSLGFRGEALASISSVSRFKLISRTKLQKEAWQTTYTTQLLNNKRNLIPIAHPIGTTLEVCDLFYNTPARRKFLRTETTEFFHIDKIIRCIALARFDVTITLTNNGKLIRHYLNQIEPEHRIDSVFGNIFRSRLLRINWEYKDMKLHGWVSYKNESSIPNDLQYFYVNGRIVHNRLLYHVIRQTYYAFGNEDRVKFILYLTINPKEIDINVHPTKHDVRFYQSQLIYEFIHQGLVNTFKEYNGQNLLSRKNSENHQLLKTNYKKNSLNQNNEIPNFGKVLSILEKDIALVEDKNGLILIALSVAQKYSSIIQLKSNVKKKYPLLIPLRFNIKEKKFLDIIYNNFDLFQKLGIHLVIDNNLLIVRSVPLILRWQKLHEVFSKLFTYISTLSEISEINLINFLVKYLEKPKEWNLSQVIDLFDDLIIFCPDLIRSPPMHFLQRIDINSALSVLKNNYDKSSNAIT